MFVRIVCDDCGREIKPWEWYVDYDGEIQCPACEAKEGRPEDLGLQPCPYCGSRDCEGLCPEGNAAEPDPEPELDDIPF